MGGIPHNSIAMKTKGTTKGAPVTKVEQKKAKSVIAHVTRKLNALKADEYFTGKEAETLIDMLKSVKDKSNHYMILNYIDYVNENAKE